MEVFPALLGPYISTIMPPGIPPPLTFEPEMARSRRVEPVDVTCSKLPLF